MIKWLVSIFEGWVLGLDVVKKSIEEVSTGVNQLTRVNILRDMTFNYKKLDDFIAALNAQGVTLDKNMMAHVVRFAQVMGIPITAFDEFAQLARDKRAMYYHQIEYAQRLREQAKIAEEEAADLRATMNRLAEIAELGGTDPFFEG
ncbi:MAG TPA: hypothetical protein PK367_03465 [Candidatus Paceibacterota bacterium]|nr:hypothetical protein [Candidatus Paceibacterota bacterium]